MNAKKTVKVTNMQESTWNEIFFLHIIFSSHIIFFSACPLYIQQHNTQRSPIKAAYDWFCLVTLRHKTCKTTS